MDHCASVLLSFPSDIPPLDNFSYDTAIKSHVARINRLFKEQDSVIASSAEKLLDCLDPEVNSLSYLALLDAFLPSDPKTAEVDAGLLERMILFLSRFDPRQIRYYGIPFSNLFTTVGSGHLMPPSVAVPLLADALLRIDPSGSVLTSNHLILLKLAYSSGVIDPVFPVLDKSIVYFPNMINQPDPRNLYLCDEDLPPSSYISKDTGLTTRITPFQALVYDWLTGLAYCSKRDWSRAQAAFARAASHPTRDVSASKVMVESYKKWVLVSLLGFGNVPWPGVPVLASQSAARIYGVLGKAYAQLAEHYRTLDAEAMKLEVEAGRQQFADDGNLGLVTEALEAHQKWQIIRLRDIYSKISFAEINAKTKSAVTGAGLATEAEVVRLVTGMIESGMLRAMVVPSDGGANPIAYLSFLPVEEDMSESDVAQQIKDVTGRIVKLGAAYQATKERLTTSKEFIKQAVKEQQRRGGDLRAEAEIAMELDDEDLMAGVVSGR